MKIACILAFLSVCILHCASLRAQTPDSTKTDSVQKPRENWYWAHGTINVNYPGPSLWQIALSSAFNNNLVTLRLNRTFSPIAVVDLPDGTWLPHREEIGVLYGLTARDQWFFAAVSGGLAYVTGVNSISPLTYSTVGLAFEAHAAFKAYCIGLGISIIGNLNLYHSYLGLGLTAHLGWMP